MNNEEKQIREEISKILIKWGMPTRQVAILEITNLVAQAVQQAKRETVMELLAKTQEVEAECKKQGYDFPNYIGIIKNHLESLSTQPSTDEQERGK